jgi:ApaG protein
MVTAVTSGIQVSVETFYQPQHSSKDKHFFAYRITILNNSEYTVQLKTRHWYVFDSSGTKKEIKGEGVVGEQPVIAPGDSYEYISGCDVTTDIGQMHGSYFMERTIDKQLFSVTIPAFSLITPARLN